MSSTERRVLLINFVTASRLLMAAPVAVLARWSGSAQWAIVCSTLLVLAIEVSDLLDGWLARRHEAVSQWGKLFDPYADSLARLTVYWALAVVGRCLAPVPLIMAVRDVSVAYCRLLLMRRGRDVAARLTGKLKAMVQGACGLALMAGPLYWGRFGPAIIWTLSLAVIAISLASLTDYGRAALRSD